MFAESEEAVNMAVAKKGLMKEAKNWILAAARHARTNIYILRSGGLVKAGDGLHIGKNARLWAPNSIEIGRQVYLGADVHIECDCIIGDYAILANRVAIIGRHDHDYSTVGVPIRFGYWIGSRHTTSKLDRIEGVAIEADVWVGFGALILSGVKVGRGAIVAAGSVLTKDVAPYDIVAGVPAKKIGCRFTQDQLYEHEQRLARGEFYVSERGFDHFTIRPYIGELT